MGQTLDILLIEAYHGGSHRSWVRGLMESSRHHIHLLEMPARFWKWRMHGAALTTSRRLRELGLRPDLVLASDMLDLATFLGLARDRLEAVPALLYMHENQLAYPKPPPRADWDASRRRRAERQDAHYPFVNLSSALAADEVWWSSSHNRDSFLAALPAFLRSFPDAREPRAVEALESKSRIMPLGMDLSVLDRARPLERTPGPPRILWNHRWEHDKDPSSFFAAIEVLEDRGLDYELVILGESFARYPPEFEAVKQSLAHRIRHIGYLRDRDEYAGWLWQSDLVVSTSRHEFFGLSVCEAIYCGCLPLLPDRLSYPEILGAAGRQWLYPEGGLVNGLLERVARIGAAPQLDGDPILRERIAGFAWPKVARRYDRAFERRVAAGRAARVLY